MSYKIDRNWAERNGWIDTLARVVVGVVFVFSSLVKAFDPYGTILKMDEYFVAMGLEWLSGVGSVLAVGLIVVEMVVGVMLMLRALPKIMAYVALIFNGFYLLLTLWIAVKNPVADCGCFGDVLVLSNWQTFGKNVILVLLSLVIFRYRNHTKGSCWAGYVSLGVGAGTLAFVIYSLIMLPVVEKFPFGEGVNLPQAIEQELISEAEQTFVICRSLETGKEHRFGVNDQEWWDATRWEYVRTDAPKSELKVRVSEFRIWAGVHDITLDVFDAKRCHLLLVEKIERLNDKEIAKIQRLAADSGATGDRVILVTASPLHLAQNTFPTVEFGNMDPVVMRALLRAPAGVVTLERGTIVYKASLARLK